MTASTKPKTPSMELIVRRDTSEDHVNSFCKRASRLTLSQIVNNVMVREQLASTRRRRFAVTISFYPSAEYKQEYEVSSAEVLQAFGSSFPLLLKKAIVLELKKLQADLKSHIAGLGHGKAERKGSDNINEDADVPDKVADDVSEVGDGDAGDEKRARQAKELATYESDDEEPGDNIGEFDDAGLEAEFSDEANDGDGERTTETNSKKSPLGEVKEQFHRILTMATTFNFSEEEVKFDLEVSVLRLDTFSKNSRFPSLDRPHPSSFSWT